MRKPRHFSESFWRGGAERELHTHVESLSDIVVVDPCYGKVHDSSISQDVLVQELCEVHKNKNRHHVPVL
jgi:hypothetical protein